MAGQLTPKDQLEYYQQLLENLHHGEDSELREYYISKYEEQVEDLMYHIMKHGNTWDT